MRKVLIISPLFPPTNTPDSQRIRMSLPYFKKYGWSAEVVTVDQTFSDLVKDPYLIESIPKDIPIHYVSAFKKNWTSKIGFGNIGYRSILFYREYVDRLLKDTEFDLIYFSTTQFSVCLLGKHWKEKWGIPYVIDIQDMWHSEYYQSKSRKEQPPKYWISYPLNKYLEKEAMQYVDGLISVSKNYLDILKQRYTHLKNVPSKTITFGASNTDFSIAKNDKNIKPAFKNDRSFLNLLYVGRGGYDLADAVELLFAAFRNVIATVPEAKKIRFHFLGTSYAPPGTGDYTIIPLAKAAGIEEYVYEQPDRIGFYQTISSLLESDALFIPGSNDPNYTASKVFSYILAEKPLFAIFNSQSNAVKILQECSNADVLLLDKSMEQNLIILEGILTEIASGNPKAPIINKEAFRKYSADALTEKQTQLFNSIIDQT
jgi:hypothetical protein